MVENNKVFLVTGASGFIGYYLTKALLAKRLKVIGVDNVNDYYDLSLKEERLSLLQSEPNFIFIKQDISNKDEVLHLFETYKPQFVINLAAQAGVRYSLENPDAYIQSNVQGFYNILEACKQYPVEHLVYASSSSVYGSNKKVPFEESDNVDNPVSLYAATKKTNELMAQTYSHLYNIKATGLRFFTVYGPMGRPDMAYFNFVDRLFNGEAIQIYNNGDFDNDLYRDFTYIDDIIDGIMNVLFVDFETSTKHNIFNIGNNKPVKLMHFIEALEQALSKSLGKKVEFVKQFEPIKRGDVSATYASTAKLEEAVGFKPQTTIEHGLQKFTDWYVKFYSKKIENYIG